jgi:CRP/FNR family transcriptional regulator, cyclic AMP receptor protein
VVSRPRANQALVVNKFLDMAILAGENSAMDSAILPAEHWLVQGVPEAQLMPLLAAGEERHYHSGEAIFQEGDPATGLFLVLTGNVRVTTTSDDGETFLSVARPNEVLGEMGVLDGENRSATATAVNASVLYYLPTDPVLDVLERSPMVCMRLLAVLTARLRSTNRRLAELPPASLFHRDQEITQID